MPIGIFLYQHILLNSNIIENKYFRYNVGPLYNILILNYCRKVNPGDCVDLDCDAMKKLLVQDEDGSLLGSPGAYLPASSEFEWDGDKRRGIGDYRIPVPMQTDYLTGNRIPFSDLYDEKGNKVTDHCSLWT